MNISDVRTIAPPHFRVLVDAFDVFGRRPLNGSPDPTAEKAVPGRKLARTIAALVVTVVRAP
jgi:hypothetical protein